MFVDARRLDFYCGVLVGRGEDLERWPLVKSGLGLFERAHLRSTLSPRLSFLATGCKIYWL